jgi:translation initiation factor IF-3
LLKRDGQQERVLKQIEAERMAAINALDLVQIGDKG